MKKSIYYILFVILFVVLVIVYFSKPSGSVQRLESIEKAYADSIGSIRREYNTILLERDRQALKAFMDAQNAANRYEGEAVYWKGQFNKEKDKNRRFTDFQTDSLLSLVK